MKLYGSNILSRQDIDRLIKHGLNYVWFPKRLEQKYRQLYQGEAAKEFRFRAPIIFALYFFLSFGIYQLLPSSQVKQWLLLYGWVGVIIVGAWVLSFFRKLDPWFDWYTGLGSACAVMLTFTVINLINGGMSNILLHA